MSKEYPTPWTFEAEDAFENSPIKAANGEYVLVRDNGVYPPDLETCREIVDAVNERDHLRDLVKRLITVHENIFWRKDEQTGMFYYDCAIDEEKMRKTIEEARETIKGDK